MSDFFPDVAALRLDEELKAITQAGGHAATVRVTLPPRRRSEWVANLEVPLRQSIGASTDPEAAAGIDVGDEADEGVADAESSVILREPSLYRVVRCAKMTQSKSSGGAVSLLVVPEPELPL